jgi:hypothetical protein
MRTLTVSVVAAMATLLMLPLPAMASDLPITATSSATSNDTAKGGGATQNFVLSGFPDSGIGAAQVSFSSVANFNGTEPRGSMKATIGPDTFQGDVTCQQVSGNTAFVAGIIDHALGAETFGGLPANTWGVLAVDNGSSGDELVFSISPTPVLEPFGCSTGLFEGVFEQADVEIHDG